MAYRISRGLAAWRGMGALATPPANVQTALQSASTTYGVPLSLLQALAFQESSYNPAAVSSAGAQGLLQLMPATGASLGVTNAFDLQQNANAGASYLKSLYSQYGNWSDALVAYNEGPGNFAKSGAFASSQQYADTILSNAGLNDMAAASSGASADLSSLFDLSTMDASGVSVSAWVIGGVLLAGLGIVWAAS